MNKAELVDFVAGETSMTKRDAVQAINAVLMGVKNGLMNDLKVTLVGFGTFSVVTKAAHTARNPKTGESVDVPEKRVPKFKPSNMMKDEFNETI